MTEISDYFDSLIDGVWIENAKKGGQQMQCKGMWYVHEAACDVETLGVERTL